MVFPDLPVPEQGQLIVAFLRSVSGVDEPTGFAAAPGFGVIEGGTVTFPTVKLSSDVLAPEITIRAATLDEIRDAMDRGVQHSARVRDIEENDDWKAIIELGERQDALIERAREGADPEDLQDYAFSIGLTPDSWSDPSVCRKFEAVIADLYGIPVNLDCPPARP